VSGRGEGKTPDFELTTWRINASRAPGAWPGPATTFLIPTEEEFAEFGNGKIYPGVGTENVTLEEFVRSFHTGHWAIRFATFRATTINCYPNRCPK
jgi:hypothetical protein